MNISQQDSSATNANVSSRTINLVIGLVALFLAPSLWLIGILDETNNPYQLNSDCHASKHLALSISHYYCWTDLTRNLFVGALTGMGMLFIAYRGWSRNSIALDRFLGISCGLMAFAVANFSTVSDYRLVHFLSATVLFAILSFIAFCRFTDLSRDKEEELAWKHVRNGIYRLCSTIMILGIILCLSSSFITKHSAWEHSTFVGEMVTLTAFGVAWLTKSRIIFGYKRNGFDILYNRSGWINLFIFSYLAKLDKKCKVCKYFSKALD